MRFNNASLDYLAQYICGDEPLPFPYRRAWDISEFFRGLGINFSAAGFSRNPSVRRVLTDLNLASSKEGHLPSAELVSIVEELMDSANFSGSRTERVNYGDALDKMNELLSHYGLEVVHEETGTRCKLRHSHGVYVSSAMKQHEARRKITFCPTVFEVPKADVERDLVAVMMPFADNFSKVYASIKLACELADLRCQRADDIWKNSVIIQDIFHLIFTSSIVIVDFTDKNPNVMYETGIAHTLGKHVVPITRSLADVPFDMKHHRVMTYFPNGEGLDALQRALTQRLVTISDENKLVTSPPSHPPVSGPSSRISRVPEPAIEEDDDIPF